MQTRQYERPTDQRHQSFWRRHTGWLWLLPLPLAVGSIWMIVAGTFNAAATTGGLVLWSIALIAIAVAAKPYDRGLREGYAFREDHFAWFYWGGAGLFAVLIAMFGLFGHQFPGPAASPRYVPPAPATSAPTAIPATDLPVEPPLTTTMAPQPTTSAAPSSTPPTATTTVPPPTTTRTEPPRNPSRAPVYQPPQQPLSPDSTGPGTGPPVPTVGSANNGVVRGPAN